MKFQRVFLLLAIAFLASASSLSAQIYHHQLGGGLLGSDDGFGLTINPVIFYEARFNIAEPSSDLSISINAAPGGFIDGVISSRGGSAGSVVFDIPAYVSANLGGYSTYTSDSYFGGFAGLGYEFSTFASTFGGSGVTSGPMAIGGLRFLVADNPYQVAVSYMLGLNDNPSQVGLRLSFLLGDY